MKVQDRRLPTDMVKRPTPREQALVGGWKRFPDRREERGVECCLKQKGAYYGDRTAPAQKRRCPPRRGRRPTDEPPGGWNFRGFATVMLRRSS